MVRVYSDSIKEVRFLRRGSWYDFASLSDVDVLISLLDDFDIARARAVVPSTSMSKRASACKSTLPSSVEPFAEVKPALIAIAWARNWFQRWLQRPYIGNFDLIMVSSDHTKRFFDDYSERFGFRTQCVHHCPAFPSSATIQTSPSSTQEIRLPHLTPRVMVPIVTFRIATNPLFFDNNTQPSAEFMKYDYGFTGSYFNVPRKINSFNPTSINGRFRGVVVGSGWQRAQLTDAWRNMTVGPRPYRELPQVRSL